MKTSGAFILAAASLVSTAIVSGYLARTASRVHQLEQRLRVAEVAMHSQNHASRDGAVAARILGLEERLQQVEALARIQPATGDGIGLEQRIQKVERDITPHMEPLPPYLPAK